MLQGYETELNNTGFKNPKRRLYTWDALWQRNRHHLYYTPVKQRFRNSVKDVQTLPGADIDSHHSILVANICTRLKKIILFQKQNQDGIWRSNMCNDRECKIVAKKNSIQPNVIVGL
jgi:hypothetical protein